MRTMSRTPKIVILFGLLAMILAACGGEDKAEQGRRADVDVRWQLFDRASTKYPVPVDQIQNFPQREALVKYTLRQDAVNHPWFIYLYSMTGEAVGYYVGQTYPQSACNFLSSSEDQVDVPHDGDSSADFNVSAPSLDGMYYSGSGSNAACESMFFFDASTDAMITFTAQLWVATDIPVSGFAGPALGQTTVDDVTPAEVPAP